MGKFLDHNGLEHYYTQLLEHGWVSGESIKTVGVTLTVEGAKGDDITITNSDGEVVGGVIFEAEATQSTYALTIEADSEMELTFESSVTGYSRNAVINKDTSHVYVFE